MKYTIVAAHAYLAKVTISTNNWQEEVYSLLALGYEIEVYREKNSLRFTNGKSHLG